MYKLPIQQILKDAFTIPWRGKSLFARTLALPVLALVSTWAVLVVTEPESILLSYMYMLLNLAAFSYFAVTCHRLILVNSNPHGSYNTLRVLHFLKWVVIVYGISLGLEMVSLTLFMNIYKDFNVNNIETIRDILSLPLMYLVGRFSLIFPATALDLKGSLRWSWIETRNNGLNILFIVGVLPWLMYTLLSLIQREAPSIVEQAILMLLMYLIAAIGIFALSLSYKSLHTNAQKQL